MLPLFVILLIAIAVLVVTYFCSVYTYWLRRGILQEPTFPPFGSYKGIGSTNHLKDINRRLYMKFKGKAQFAGLYIFVKKAVILLDLDLAKQILVKDFPKFHSRGIYCNVADDPLTGHLVCLDGQEWRDMRQKLTPVFTSAKMKYMFPTIVKVGKHYAKVLSSKLDEPIDVKAFCARFIVDVLGSCAFGLESNCLENPHEEFFIKGMSVFNDRRHHPLIEQFILFNPEISKRLHLKLFKDEVAEYFLNIIKQTVDYRLSHNVKRNDFMDLLIEMRSKDEEDENAKTSQHIDISNGLTTVQMATQAFSFLVAGFESSSTTMSFCLYELALNMEIQEKLRSEIFDNLKENRGDLTYEGLNAMEYLDQVVKETLRMYPPIAQVARVSDTDYHIPNSSSCIPKGTVVIVPLEAIQHDADYFKNPETFDPSHFELSECERRHPYAYLPFGDGPRNCIALRFGLLQTKIGLVSLLQHFRVEKCSDTQIPIQFDMENFFTTAKDGIRLKLIALEK